MYSKNELSFNSFNLKYNVRFEILRALLVV